MTSLHQQMVKIINFFHWALMCRVPEKWKRISWRSTTLGFWYTELLERDGQFKRWCFHGRPKVRLQDVMACPPTRSSMVDLRYANSYSSPSFPSTVYGSLKVQKFIMSQYMSALTEQRDACLCRAQ